MNGLGALIFVEAQACSVVCSLLNFSALLVYWWCGRAGLFLFRLAAGWCAAWVVPCWRERNCFKCPLALCGGVAFFAVFQMKRFLRVGATAGGNQPV